MTSAARPTSPEIVPRSARARGRSGDALALGFLAAAMLLWGTGLPQIDPGAMDDLGLVSVLPWTSWAALGLVIGGFWLVLRSDRRASWLPPLFVLALVLILHGTPAIAYETLRYSWAWKHVGIVDYIQRHGAVDLSAPYLAANHNWPGFFVVAAWVSNLFELRPLQIVSLARFMPVLLNILWLLPLVAIYRQLAADRRHVWSAAFIFVLGNWVGQDYFSPQGTSFLLYLVCLWLCVGPLRVFRQQEVPPRGWIARLQAQLSRGMPEPASLSGRTRVLAAVALLLLTAAIVATHQLTPLVLLSALSGLALIGWVSFGYAVFAAAATAGWALYFAAPFVGQELPDEIAGLGRSIAHVSDSLVDVAAIASAGQVWVILASRLLSAAIALAAVLGGLRRLAAGQRDGPAVVLSLAPVPLLAGTSYGGEIIFRVYLFALPFLAFFAAGLFFPRSTSGHSWPKTASGAVLTACLTFGFLLANNGKDRQYYFSPQEVAAATWLYERAPPGTLLVEGARNYPSQFMNYENFTYVPLSAEAPEERLKVLADPALVLGRWLSEPGWSAGYVIITRSQKAYVEALGLIPPGGYDRVEEALLASPRFILEYANEDVRIFTANPSLLGAGAWADRH